MDKHLNLFLQNTPNLFVQRLPPLHCSITKKGKLYKRTMNYCKRKLGNNDCDDMEGSIIFQSGMYSIWNKRLNFIKVYAITRKVLFNMG